MIDQEQKALDEAIQKFIVPEGSGGILTSYVLVAHVMAFDEGERTSYYPVVVLDNEQPRHISKGLLGIADEQIDIAAFSCDVEEDEG